MIEGLENLRALFAVFHDGRVNLRSKADASLEVSIQIRYLTQRINPEYTRFILSLREMGMFSYQPWVPPDQVQSKAITDPTIVFGFNLELISSDIKENRLAIWCNANPDDEGFSCGELSLNAQSAAVFDESGREYTLD